jgi:hypothetical protein
LFQEICVKSLLIVCWLLSFALVRAEEPVPADVSAQEGEENLEPEVTIRQQGSKTIHEYRINGRLYMVKIVPERGAPYYLLDQDGDGEMDTQQDNPNGVVVPQWVLFRW